MTRTYPSTTSKQPRKQRRAHFRAPKHRARREMSAHLSGDLIEEWNVRSMPVIKGDTVRIIRGSHKGHEAKVAGIDVPRRLLTVEDATIAKADGTATPKWYHHSNVIITKLLLEDPKRRGKLEELARRASDE
jgi:large subunit ribosomal protein L24